MVFGGSYTQTKNVDSFITRVYISNIVIKGLVMNLIAVHCHGNVPLIRFKGPLLYVVHNIIESDLYIILRSKSLCRTL